MVTQRARFGKAFGGAGRGAKARRGRGQKRPFAWSALAKIFPRGEERRRVRRPVGCQVEFPGAGRFEQCTKPLKESEHALRIPLTSHSVVHGDQALKYLKPR